MKKENIILLILSSIYALIIEYMFYPNIFVIKKQADYSWRQTTT